jgi:hypothetical protein
MQKRYSVTRSDLLTGTGRGTFLFYQLCFAGR